MLWMQEAEGADAVEALRGDVLKEAAQEFEMYLKLEPNGKNAAEAKTTFEALKPMLK